jgi:hypothetical protein
MKKASFAVVYRIVVTASIIFTLSGAFASDAAQAIAASGARQPVWSIPQPAKPTQPSSEMPMMPMPLAAPMFVEPAELSSTMTIVNAAAGGATANVLVLDSHGVQIV